MLNPGMGPMLRVVHRVTGHMIGHRMMVHLVHRRWRGSPHRVGERHSGGDQRDRHHHYQTHSPDHAHGRII